MKVYIKSTDYSDEDKIIEDIALTYQDGDVTVIENRWYDTQNKVAHELANEMKSLNLDHDYEIRVFQEFVSAERADGGKIEGSDYDKLEPIADREYSRRDYNHFSQTRDDYKNRKADALFVTTKIHYVHMD